MHLDFESELWNCGYVVAGIDEAGRGALAGPVCAAAVVLNDHNLAASGVKDSKKLTEKQRNKLFDVINELSVDYSFYFVDNVGIDQLNILKSTHYAMKRSIENLKNKPSFLLIDGNSYAYDDIKFKTIVDGDNLCLSISAASIVAKVKRDEWMINIADKEFPEYNFAKNKGYGTKEHFFAIDKYGICKYHRRTFMNKYNIRYNELKLF